MYFGRIANRLGIIKKSFSRFVDCVVFYVYLNIKQKQRQNESI